MLLSHIKCLTVLAYVCATLDCVVHVSSRWLAFAGVSKSGRTELILVDPAVKINGAFYRDPCFVARDLSWRVPYLRQNSTHGARDNQPSGTADSRVCFIRTSSSPQITAVSCPPFKSNRFIWRFAAADYEIIYRCRGLDYKQKVS